MSNEIKTITIEDKCYPKRLKKISNPPKVLYYRGKLISDEDCFGIVGTRIPSPYGKQAAMNFAADLSQAGLTIVSGLAPGIDTISHQTVVEQGKPARNGFAVGDVGGRTIAVLGTGLDEKCLYPQSNLKLAQKILETGGCLISEYPPGTRGSNFSFPQRNRIISGLSSGVLVIEAKQKSGALITADWARKQKRKIFAVPGSIYSQNSKGCHFLIKQGAKLVENTQDILKELKELNLGLLVSDANRQIKGENREENLILEALREKALYVDEIIEKTKLNAAKINSSLAVLEMKGIIKNLGGNIYALKG